MSRALPQVSSYFKRLIAGEISAAVRFYDGVALLAPLNRESETTLFEALRAPTKRIVREPEELVPLTSPQERWGVVLDGNLNHSYDIEGELRRLHGNLGRHARVFAVVYNAHLSPLYRLLRKLGLRSTEVPTSFLTASSLKGVAELAGFRVVRIRHAGLLPFRLFGIGDWLNRWAAAIPVIRSATLCSIVVLQPRVSLEKEPAPSLSIVIPARNEKGNIEPLFGRLGALSCSFELIFVEGHSIDGTWEEIQRCQNIYGDRFKIQAIRQSGVGKVDAVRVGFEHATQDLLTILDADLTMPPELLGRFYDAYVRGDADFVNGNRLFYPMEGEAMRFLNWLGNLFFARTMSFVLDCYLGDTLCGTKLLARHDYARLKAWRQRFGDFDPFGDFELLFPAAILGLGIVEVPIRYRARSYGSTNISRFRHGWQLLRMVMIGFFRVKPGAGP